MFQSVKVTGIKLMIWSQLSFGKEVVNATHLLKSVLADDQANF